MRNLFRLSTVPLLAALAGCGGDNSVAPSVPAVTLSEAVGAKISSCEGIKTSFTFANTAIDSAVVAPAGTITLAGAPIAAHCLVKGKMNERTGSDGRTYAIGFEMRLPNDWNGRYFYQANGGLDGSVVTAVGAFGGGATTHALAQGFAVLSSDAGHTGAQTTAFGFEPQARLDYGYQAVGKLTPMAKALVKSGYGKVPDRSYIGGCSNGGRHTLVAAARYGDQYDGFIAGAPGYQLPKSAVAAIWSSQQFAKVMTPGATTLNGANTIPDLSTGFTAAERRMVAGKILQKCDALDGLNDGLIQDPIRCQATFNFAVDVPTCSGARDGSCLTADQKTVVAAVHAGAKTSASQAIYSPFWFDSGIGYSNWALWKFVNSIALDPLAAGTIFRATPAFIPNSLTVDVDSLNTGIYATNATFTEAGMTFMTPPNPSNLATLRDRGAKVLVYHGASDPIFSAADSLAWYQSVAAANNGDARNFARLFTIPSMPHCSGGTATDQFDPITPMVNWVERGIAPDSIFAAVRGVGNAGGINAEIPSAWSQTRSRPLCAYPTVATYVGGDSEQASSFRCQ